MLIEMIAVRLFLFQIDALHLENQSGLDYNQYSLFKYGDREATKQFGESLSNLLIDADAVSDTGDSYLISCSPYKNVPVAAKYLMDSVVDNLKGNRVNAEDFKIDRSGVTKGDYSKMSIEERTEAQNDINLTVDQDLTGKEVILVDDVYITGAHEVRLREFFKSQNVKKVTFLYIALVSHGIDNPSVESFLNSSKMQNWKDWLDMALNYPYLNTRFLKYLLNIDISSYNVILSKIGTTCRDYVRGIELDNIQVGKQEANFEIFKSKCNKLR